MAKIKKRKKSNLILAIMIMMMSVLALFAVAATFIGYKQFTHSFSKQYTETAVSIAKVARNIVNADHLDYYVATNGTTFEYKSALGRLDALCNAMNATYIYVIRVDTSDYNHIEFVFSTVNANIDSEPFPIGYLRETTNADYRQRYKNIYEDGWDSVIVVRNRGLASGHDPHITALIPMYDTQKNVVALMAVERTMNYLNSTRRIYLYHIILAVIVLIIIANILYGYLIHKNVVSRILAIKKETVRFANENTEAKEPLSQFITTNNELRELAFAVDTMERQTLEYFNNLNLVTAERERIGAELNIATKIQAGLLPHEFAEFSKDKNFDIYASMTPAKEVGGDFYDFFFVDDDHLALVIADVSGKGVSAALFMMAAKTSIKYRATMLGGSPAEILGFVNNHLCENNEAEMFVSVWLGILELSTGKLVVANGGHENPAIRKADGKYELITDKHNFVLGGMPDVPYKNFEYKIEKGGSVFIYTDGVAEATDANEELYGTDRMISALNGDVDAAPEKLILNVKRNIYDFVKDAPQFDDITMLALKLR